MTFGDKRLPTRFWSKVQRDMGSSCWLWTSETSDGGYGRFRWDGRRQPAHRVSYEALVGRVPEGLELDHVAKRGCHNRNCVRPSHLEPVTHAENIRRGRIGDFNRGKKMCPQGHRYTAANTLVRRCGGRVCKTCHRDRQNAHHAANRDRINAGRRELYATRVRAESASVRGDR